MPWNRLWMTGCMALVLMLAGRMARAETEDVKRGPKSRLQISSKYDLDETTRRVEAMARELGWRVMARTSLGEDDQGERVLVWSDAAGRTPAVQVAGAALPMLPWQVTLRPLPEGGTAVSLIDPSAVPLPPEAAPTWRSRLAQWPQALRQALS